MSARVNALVQGSRDTVPPKRPMPAMYFYACRHLEVGPFDPRTFTREQCMQAWEALGEEGKERWQRKAAADKERFEREVASFIATGRY